MNRAKASVIAVLVAMYGSYFVHLAADRPGILRWDDTSVYTDEGWYVAASIHSVTEHHWYLPHSFNPSILVPGWPALMRLWFALTGVGMVSARVLALLLFGVSLYCTWRLLERAAGWVAASVGAALLLVNPYVYAFERLALLEPVVIVTTVAGLWIALRKPIATVPAAVSRGVLVGALLLYGVLGKTTAVAFAPSLLVALFAVSFHEQGTPWWQGLHPRRFVAPAVAVATAAMLWLAYFFLLVKPYPYRLESFRAVYRINATHINIGRLPEAIWHSTVFASLIGPAVFVLAFVVLLASVLLWRDVWKRPLFAAAALNFTATLFLFGYRSWLLPRYYQLCLIPMTILVVLGWNEVWQRRRSLPAFVLPAASAAVAAAGVWMAVSTVGYELRPTYTFRDSATAVAATVRADKSVPPVLLAASGEDIALWTGIPSWNPIWPLHGLQAILDTGKPGWYAVYAPQGPLTMPELERNYTLVEAGRYTVMPNPVQRQLVLFKLVPKK